MAFCRTVATYETGITFDHMLSTTVPFPRIDWSATLGGRSDRAPWTVDLSVPQAWRLALQAEGGL